MNQMNNSERGRLGAIAKHKKHSQVGDKNPNWKGGISKNNYHYKKIQKERYPEKIRAREMVHYAVKTGKLIKPDKCKCGKTPVYAHHKDYNQPLKVVWLCKKCHLDVHGEKD